MQNPLDMKALIVATDFSPEAENALEYAGAAARDLNAKVVLYNSFTIPPHFASSLFPASALDELTKQNQAALGDRAAKLAQKYNIEVAFESFLMDLEDQLEIIINKYNADLVVMGMAKKSLNQDLFGNTTTAAIAKLKIPVLAIPLHVQYKSIKKILFACDILRGVHAILLERIKVLAEKLDAEIEIFHVHQRIQQLDISKTTDEIDNVLGSVKHYYKNVQATAVIAEIEKEIKAIDADLLIMVPYKYGFWSSLIHTSKTRIMASNSEVPLLSIPM